MSDLRGEVVVDRTNRLDRELDWLIANRSKEEIKDFLYSNLPRNVIACGLHLTHHGYRVDALIEGDLLGQLISEVAVERPQWTFLVQTQRWDSDALARLRKVTIIDTLEPIGVLHAGEDYQHGKHVTISNNRIKQDLMTKNARLTGKLQRAKQIINKEVFGLSKREVLNNGARKISTDVRYAADRLRARQNEEAQHLRDWFAKGLDTQSPELIAFAQKMGQAEIIQTFMDAVENHALGSNVADDINAGRGKMVVLVGEDYHVAPMGGVKYIVGHDDFSHRYFKYTRDTLDPGIHTALALLKLTEPNTFISGAGFKASPTEYFIVEEITIGQD